MKKFVAIILTITVVLSLAACGTTAQSVGNSTTAAAPAVSNEGNATNNVSSNKKSTIGFIFITLTDTSLIRIKEDCEATCKEMGINFTAVDSKADSATQIDQIENMIEVSVDAIIIQAVDTQAVTPYLQKAMDKGIKVVAFGIETEIYDVWYRNDPEVIGNVVAGMATDWINANANGEADVGILTYPQMANFIRRVDASKAYFAEHAPGVKVVSEEAALGTEEALTAVENMLQANPNLNVIVCFSDGAALGANEAFKSAGKKIGEAAVFGSDISAPGAEVILNKEFYLGSTDVSSLLLGKTAITICTDLISGETVEGLSGNKELVMDVFKVDESNASTYLN